MNAAGGDGIRIASNAPSADVVEAGLQQLSAAVASGEIKPRNSKKYAGGVYKFDAGSDLAKKYPNGVRFSDEGFPDFSPYARAIVRIRMRGTSTDFGEANRVAGPEVTDTFGQETWHHVEDRTTMQLIPSDLHDPLQHTGGEGIIRRLGVLP